MKEATKTVVVVNNEAKAEVKDEKKRGRKPGVKTGKSEIVALKKAATAATNNHIKAHRKTLNEIFFYLEDGKLDVTINADFKSELNILTHEYEEKLQALKTKLGFMSTIAAMDENQREMLKKYL